MIITLVAEKKIYSIRLPEQAVGQYWIADDESVSADNGLIHIDADTETKEWKITSGRKLQIYNPTDGTKEKAIVLKPNTIHLIAMGKGLKQRAFLFAEPFTEDRCRFTKYAVAENTKLTIGSAQDNAIVINNSFVSAGHAILTYQDKKWMVKDCKSTNGVYINRCRLQGEQIVPPGSAVYIMGCKFVLGNGFIAINNPDNNIFIKDNVLYDFPEQERVVYTEPELEENSYYYRSPSVKRELETLQIKVEAPTQKIPEDDTPIILTIAPTLMMGVASLASGIITTINALGKGNSIISVIPTLTMSVSMLAGMVIFPFFMKKRDKRRKKIREEERIQKYQKYLSNVRFEIAKAARTQSEILHENCPAIMQSISQPDFWTNYLWNRKPADSDFLSFRLGIGNVPLQAEISFPEERFSIDEDVLREQVIAFSEEKQIITDVPLSVSLMNDRIVGIYGETDARNNLLHNILLQLDALYSYDEVKLIFLGNPADEEEFSYVRWMQHIWDDEKIFRYYATSVDDVKGINAKVSQLLMKWEEEKELKQHYVVISTSKELSEKCSFLSEILANSELDHFHYICIFDELCQLPKECDVLIQLVQTKGMIHFITGENSHRTNFTQDIIPVDSVAQVVRRVADVSLDLQKGKYALPGMLTFLDMFHVGKISHLNIRRRWDENNPVLTLQTPIGVDVNGGTFYLDLHEKFHGPHGLVAGMTGSGKSEFIITFILSLAVNYHPYEVAFVLIDYKGGGLTGAFENDKYRLPHLAGTITNLDGSAITRSILSIKSELRRRQTIFNQARRIANEGTMDIYKYQKMYRNGMVEEPLPHLFIIADEFAELKTQQAEFMDQLISTARIGRSLGVHLILATQKPSGVVNEQIWANSRFKVCLKVQDKADSMDMLKRADAAEIAETGRFYLQVGYNEIFEKGQSAWCGAPYIERENVEEELDSSIELIDHVGNVVEDIKVQREGDAKANGKQIVRIMEYLSELAAEEQIRVRQLWLPEIPAMILLDDIRAKYEFTKQDNLVAVIGELDDPYRQKQELLSMDFTQDGNAIIYGVSGSGKESLLVTMLFSLINDYSAKELNIYALDFGAELLKSLEGAPQVGDVVIDGQDEKIESLIGMLRGEIDNRKKLFAEYGADYSVYKQNVEDPVPSILVIINNYSPFMESYERYEQDLTSITRECVKYGIYFVLTEATVNGVRHRMAQNFNQTLVLQFNDKSEYLSILGSTGGVYPAKINGRGILKRDETYVFQTAHVIADQNAQAMFLRDRCRELMSSSSSFAKRIPVLPDSICATEIVTKDILFSSVPLGITSDTLEILEYDFERRNTLAIVAQRYEDTVPFVAEFQNVLANIPESEIIVFTDQVGKKRAGRDNVRYITTDFETEIQKLFARAVERNNNYKSTNGNPTVDMHPTIYIFDSIDAIRSHLTDDGYSKLYNAIEHTEGKYGMAYLLVDSAAKMNEYSRQSWYARKCESEGLWIGQGVTGQSIMMILENKNQIPTKKADKSFGYLIEAGKARSLRLITGAEEGTKDE